MNETMNGSFLERAKRCYEVKELERLGLAPDPEQRNLILTYLSAVLRGNPGADLVSVADEDQLFMRHFCDSIQLLLLFGFKKGATVLDIGPSGGFPAIPIKIFRPDLSFTIVEPNRKKAAFLIEVKAELGFACMEVIVGKAESVSPDKKADYVTCRGTGSLQKFAQTAKPLLNKDGRMYTYKTKNFETELNDITANKDKYGIQISEIAQYDLGNIMRGLNLVSMSFC